MVHDRGLVSVVIPAYNAENYISDSILSVLQQTYQNLEIIVVDDASIDNTLKVVQGFNDKRIALFSQEINRGPGAARNVGMHLAKGLWIAFLDADDLWEPCRLEKLFDDENKTWDSNIFLADDSYLCFDTNSGLKKWGSLFKIRHNLKSMNKFEVLDFEDYLKIGVPVIHPIISTKLIRENSLQFNEEIFLGEDLDFYYQIFRTGAKLILFFEPSYLYRITPGSLTSKNNNDQLIWVLANILAGEKEETVYESLSEIIVNAIYDKKINKFKKLFVDKKFLMLIKKILEEPVVAVFLLKKVPFFIKYQFALWKLGAKFRWTGIE